ncbi:glycosyltransferase family 4 protein [Heyndrickxia sporothermodurans]|uniref:Glycosyltransferase family 4 protein n=3 Tax=Heyndrickxia sporothermodurans TaxID=46224 RepID=A0AB37HDV3_9BACI|nr:glycosyltransferase family 4 protein [Heyndrickxia sporothermodurans]MBL7246158.1 glycosyltransferase family 4 protein [Heyndrickxia sporothermodurans]MED3651593.1 glycosyltransferase family 4 protein [Heyndrickxia sporothermodurans]MED3656081.1 glycosyltransferase family 4 protein [Heyndrickxia sporothermodurans]MED3696933.1 glycosyltransferase family 4 protein [Heyndrickxia sporothermodurans]MED3778952.1 glycosyltransferase family 4 protein [Heyndrickxia sporothermodurans]
MMKIFHGTVEIAGQMGILSDALQKKGHYSIGYNTYFSYLGYEDYLINTNFDYLSEKQEELIEYFDIFHFHYAKTLNPSFEDLPLIQKKHKKMLMHHWGNDVRFHDKAKVNNPYVNTWDSPPNDVIDQVLTKLSAHIKEAIVQDYEVYEYVKDYYDKVHVVPIAINLSQFTPRFPQVTKEKPLILHAPTNPYFKGTAFIENVIEELRKTHNFDYRRIEGMNHKEVIKLYEEADIIIDQVLCGSYGLLSVESMALGKPVVTYIRPDLISTFPDDLPIVNANPDNLYDQVKLLLDNPILRQQLGILGRDYVSRVHDHHIIADQLLDIYAQL